MNSKCVLWVSLLLLSAASCNDDDDYGPALSTNIVFSPSPIDLQGIDARFAKDISYDVYPETKFDIFLPTSNTPTGLIIYIHGGRFIGGEKEYVYQTDSEDYPEDIRTFLDHGIAVATINYRLLKPVGEETIGVMKCLTDGQRALQYIRSRAEDFNIRKEDVFLAGSSAGAGMALWLGMSSDRSDEDSFDYIARQSTRVKGVALLQTQASYDIQDRWINEVFVDYGLTWTEFASDYEETILQFYGLSSIAEYPDLEVDRYRNDVDMLGMISSDDPEIWADNTNTPVVPPISLDIANHHAYHVREIKENADSAGVANVCYYGKDPLIYGDPSNESMVDFAIRKIGE